MERQNKSVIGSINDFAFLKSEKPSAGSVVKEKTPVPVVEKVQQVAQLNTKYDWYQNNTHVFMTFKVSGDKDLAKRAKITFETQSVAIAWDDQTITVPLSNEIDKDHSESYPFS